MASIIKGKFIASTEEELDRYLAHSRKSKEDTKPLKKEKDNDDSIDSERDCGNTIKARKTSNPPKGEVESDTADSIEGCA